MIPGQPQSSVKKTNPVIANPQPANPAGRVAPAPSVAPSSFKMPKKRFKAPEDDVLKVVLNVRDKEYIDLLKTIKEETGITYQGLIKFGVLLVFQEKQEEKLKAMQQVTSVENMKEGTSLIKVHITYVGKMKDTLVSWKNTKMITPHDASRIALAKIFEFFTNREAPEITSKSPDFLKPGATDAPSPDVVKPASQTVEDIERLGRKNTLMEFIENT